MDCILTADDIENGMMLGSLPERVYFPGGSLPVMTYTRDGHPITDIECWDNGTVDVWFYVGTEEYCANNWHSNKCIRISQARECAKVEDVIYLDLTEVGNPLLTREGNAEITGWDALASCVDIIGEGTPTATYGKDGLILCSLCGNWENVALDFITHPNYPLCYGCYS